MKLNLALVAALFAGRIFAQAPEYGPAKGTLVIQGGGSDVGTGIFETFIHKAGGLGAKIVVVPTAGGNRNPDGTLRVYKEEEVVASWKKRGVANVRMLHTHDPKVADTEEFAKILRDAGGVWFDGGRQWNIVDSYANTLTYREFHQVLERGGVIGGSSAGATIQGEYLVRGAVAGSEIVMTPEPEHERGFAFLRRSAIDQHINTRNRWDDLIPVIKKYPNLLGIGLSEGTAIVVTGDRFEVIGKWKVAVHDNTRVYQPWEKPYYVLSPGDVYDMKTRTIVKYGTGVAPAVLAAGGSPLAATPIAKPDRVHMLLSRIEVVPMSKKPEHTHPVPVIGEGATLGVIGAGVMGQTLLRGLLSGKLIAHDRVWAGDKNPATCEAASQALGIAVEPDFHARVPEADLILLCVKPNDAPVVLATLRNAGLRRETLLISILAGVGTDRLESMLGTENPLVRAMPNTPAVVGEGMTVICPGRYATKSDLQRAQAIFEAVGRCVPVDEVHFNAVTALSGSGPGYNFLIMEALADAGVRVGLPRQLALTLVAQTALGAARMVLSTGRHPAALRDDVTTPAGCTIAGLLMLEDGRIRSVLARAVEEATKTSAHLGVGPTKVSESGGGGQRSGS